MIEITNGSRRPRPGSAARDAESTKTTTAGQPNFRIMAGSSARAAEEARKAERDAAAESEAARPAMRGTGISLRARGGVVTSRPAGVPGEDLPHRSLEMRAAQAPVRPVDAAQTANVPTHAPSEVNPLPPVQQAPKFLERASSWFNDISKTFSRDASDRGPAGNPPAASPLAANRAAVKISPGARGGAPSEPND